MIVALRSNKEQSSLSVVAELPIRANTVEYCCYILLSHLRVKFYIDMNRLTDNDVSLGLSQLQGSICGKNLLYDVPNLD